ncbi:hypothetical protein [Methylococcus sp. EFPC2]|uniref:hypothetical protein n=1 Tax=Methylococcus sp. EFPC2 TaxID=2812648 RepID=UPI001968827B|nr:hypothetical protein [Methylococcus sp. EFPC2]QSA95836.1 hypothetical protein JWZ97_11350 [Methylococcus sp. EFPC2]
MIPQCIKLREFADPRSASLDDAQLAVRIVQALEPESQCWVELDFSGVCGVSETFARAFLRRLESKLPGLWLVPTHYGPHANELVVPLIERLERLRQKVWLAGCERFSTGFDQLP